jgi:hypothetical protein
MQMLIFILIFLMFSILAFGEQGTMSTDDSDTSKAEASMSGIVDDSIDFREPEVELQEEDYDPKIDDRPIKIETNQEDEFYLPTDDF